jgi:hypothetical protein
VVLVAVAELDAAGLLDVDDDEPQALRASASSITVRKTTGRTD